MTTRSLHPDSRAGVSWQNKLQQRGILEQAIASGTKPYTYNNRPGVVYQVPFSGGTARRWKALDDQKPKYKWLPSKPNGCDYFIPQGEAALKVAIDKAGGEVWIANGEPSVWTYREGGIENVLSAGFGEQTIPKNLVKKLQSLGVKKIFYPVDKDATGEKAAAKWRAALKASHIEFRPLRWGNNVPTAGDANDLWIAVQFNGIEFRRELQALEPFILPQEQPTSNPRPATKSRGSLKRRDAIEQVKRALGIVDYEFKDNGWTRRNYHCPFHGEDRNASAGFNNKTGTHNCFTCGKKTLEELCQIFNIDWHPYQPDPSHQRTAKPAETVGETKVGQGVELPELGVPTKKVNHVSDDPELDAALKTDRLILIEGPTGIGKSYRFAIHSKSYEGDFTGFAQYKLLTIAGAEANDAEHYESGVGRHGDGFKYVRRLFTSINSAPKFGRRGGLMGIDEIEQCVQWSLSSKTIENARPLWRELKASWGSADQLVGMDANLSPITVQLVETLTRQRAKVFSYTRDAAPRTLKLYSNRNALLHKMEKTLYQRRGTIGLACSSERLATETADRMGEKGFKVLKITGDNSQLSHIQAAITHPDQRAGFDLIIITSAAGAGVDFSEEIYAAFVVLDDRPLMPEEGVQLIGRFRNVKHYFGYCPSEREFKPTASAAEITAGRLLEFRQAARAAGRDFALTPEDSEMLSVWGQFEERRQRETVNFRAFFIARMERNGFTVKQVKTSAPPAFVAELDAYRKNRNNQDWQYIQVTAEGNALSNEELRKIERSGQEKTRELKLRNVRWKIETLLGRSEVTGDDRIAKDPRGRKSIRLGAEMLLDPSILLDHDLSEETEGIPIHRRQYRHNRQACLSHLLQLAGFKPGGQGYLDFIEWSLKPHPKAEVEKRFARWTEPEALQLFQRALGHYGNNATTTTGLLRWVLAQFGFDLQNHKFGSGENYTRIYALDCEPARLMLRLQTEARNAILKARKQLDKTYIEGSYIHFVEVRPSEASSQPHKPLLTPQRDIIAARKAAGLPLNPFSSSQAVRA